jgi:hypothetical protein
MKRPLILIQFLGLAMAAGCATTGGSPSDDDPLALPERFSIQYRGDRVGLRTELAAPVQQVVKEVPGAFERLGLPVARAANPNVPTFITPTLEITGQLYEGEPNEAYLDCKRSLSGEEWGVYRVELVVITELRPTEDGGTVVETLVDGTAVPKFRNTRPIPCIGTGKLEAEIASVLRFRTAKR